MISIRPISEIQFSSVLQDIKTLVRCGLADPELGTLSKQAQLLVEHCMRLTPPKSVSQGRRRVKFDLEKIFHPIDPAEMRSPSLGRLVRNSDVIGWQAFAANLKGGPLAGTRAVNPTEALHAANRDRRGRAKRTNMVTLWKERGALRDLIRAAQARVGWARAGWLRAYTALRGTRAPEWVTRHGMQRGVFLDGRGDPTRPYVAAYNDTGWGANRGESDRIVQAALSSRTRAMQTYFNTAMRLAAEGKPTQWQAKMAALANSQTAA